MALKIKICGMRLPENIHQVARLEPDFLGFIFYAPSSRFVTELPADLTSSLRDKGVEPVAVFVNEPLESVRAISARWGFKTIQLHGSEPVETCQRLKEAGLTVFKAFSIAGPGDFKDLLAYRGSCDYFLFDTKTTLPGGSGHSFDWTLLNHYTGDVPFFLSGGIRPGDASSILSIRHPRLYAVDLNSRFETSPAQKDVTRLSEFLTKVR